MNLGGALDYQSQHQPQPLTLEQEALLGFAASGVTGYALAELPYATAVKDSTGSGGNIMVNFIGRTVASADAIYGKVPSARIIKEVVKQNISNLNIEAKPKDKEIIYKERNWNRLCSAFG